MFHKEGSSVGGGPHKKRSMDVPLKKSERRSLRNTAQTFFSHLEEDDDKNDDDGNTTTNNYKDILDAAFLQGNLLQRKLTLQDTKILLYNRHSTPTTEQQENDNDWPYTSPQIVWISIESSNRKDWIHAPTLALVSALCVVSSSSSTHICPTTVIVPSAVSKFMCRGAHLMRAGMRQIVDAADAHPNDNGIVAICVSGNPQPMAIGQLTSDTSMDTIGPNTKGIGVNVWTCYGDDLWRSTQQVMEHTSTAKSPLSSKINPKGGASYNNGHYGNVGFIEGKYVCPLVALDESEEESDTNDDNREEQDDMEKQNTKLSNTTTNNNDDETTNNSVKKEEEPLHPQEQQDKSTIATTTTTETPHDDNNDKDTDSDSDDSSSNNPHDVVLEDAFGRACVSCSKSDFPMTTANFYAQHILKHATEPVQLKQTTYKKLSNFLRWKVQEGIVTVKADKGDPMAHVTSVTRGHVTLKSYRQEAAKQKSKTSTHKKKKKMALVNLYRIPHHYVSLYHLDSDDVKATTAKSPERQGTGMLTAPEARAILEKYISAHNLVDTIMAPEDVKVDGPMCDTLYKSKKPHYPTEVTRKDLAIAWLDHMEPAYALVEMPGSKITLLQKGAPPKVLVEVSMRSGRKFITRIRGLEVYGVNAEQFAKDVAKRFACSVSVEMEAADGRPALKKGCAEVTMQGNLAQELKALLLGDERLTDHGGAKDSDYCLPKNVISVTLKRGVPGKKK